MKTHSNSVKGIAPSALSEGLFYVYFPSPTNVGPHQKKTVKYEPKTTLLDTLTKECAKRGAVVDDYAVVSSTGNPVSLQVTLDHPDLADRMVVLFKRTKNVTDKRGEDLASAAWNKDVGRVRELLSEVCTRL